MEPEFRPRQSTSQRILWLALPLLLLAMVLQYTSTQAPSKDVSGGMAVQPDDTQPMKITIVLPRDSGSLKAKVTFETFAARVNACECHVEGALTGRAIGKMDPEHVRVVYRDLDLPETKARFKAMQIPAPCNGFAIDGRHEFSVPSTIPSDEGKRKVDLLGMSLNWTLEDIHAAIAQEYEKAYDKPFPVEKQDFVSRISEEIKQGRPDLVVHEEPIERGAPAQ